MQYAIANQLRFNFKQKGGHYESYFLRANHPTKKQAFWLRYTIFSPLNSTQPAIAELWGAFFDNDSVIAVQQDISLNHCDFTSCNESLKIATSQLKFAHSGKGIAEGRVSDDQNTFNWQLEYTGKDHVLTLFPARYYNTYFPKSKVLVGLPNALFNGVFGHNNQRYEINNWQGSENHNWGSKHTDEYAWGQVCGFDGAPDSFLECSMAKIKLGPFWSPWFKLAVLRVGKKEYRFNSVWQTLKNNGRYDYFEWIMQCHSNTFTLDISIKADKKSVAGLNYRNPPGGSHTCLNSKVASCDVRLSKNGKKLYQLKSKHSAAFEILTDDDQHEVDIWNIG